MGYRKLGRTSDQRNAAKTLRNVEILNEDDSTQTALQKLFGEIAERYSERQGGYTRILKVGPRRGDGAESVIIELV
ncbi:MAG: bL17 family ribosomal protein [Staphylococcus epidermidis]|nr:bL17 family ribosomal protein [Staphylococcus epidermidis]